MVSMYIAFEAKKPLQEDETSWVVDLFTKERFSPWFIKIFGKSASEHMTVHQLVNFYSKVFWQTYFQFVLSYSRQVDVNPETVIDNSI